MAFEKEKVEQPMSELKRKMVEDKRKELADIKDEMYVVYQENLRDSQNLMNEIQLGLRDEANLFDLFMKAVKAISMMTGDTFFYAQMDKLCEGKYMDIRNKQDQA